MIIARLQLPHQILNSCTPWMWVQRHTCMTNFQSNSHKFLFKITLDIPDIPFQKIFKVDSVGLPHLPYILDSVHCPFFWYYLSSNIIIFTFCPTVHKYSVVTTSCKYCTSIAPKYSNKCTLYGCPIIDILDPCLVAKIFVV